jgi:hypothetical protein
MEKIEILQKDNADMLGDMPGWLIHTGSYVAYGIILLLFAGCAIFCYPDVVTQNIRIDNVGSVEWVTVGQDGIIDRVLAEDQSPVKPNDTLAILRNAADLDDVKRFRQVLTRVEYYYRTMNPDYLRDYPFDLIMGDMTPAYEQFTKAVRECLTFHDLDGYTEKKHFLEEEGRLMQNNNNVDELSKMRVRHELFELTLNHRLELESHKHNLELAYEQMVNSLRGWESHYLILCQKQGTVTWGKSWGMNPRVHQGDTVCIVQSPAKGKPTGHIRMSEAQMSRVRKGDEVQVALHQYPVHEYGKLVGKVGSASYIPSSKTYAVEVDFADSLTTTAGIPVAYKVGMSGVAEVITAKRSVLDRVFAPLLALLTQENKP